MAEFKTIETQEQLDAIIKQRLEREKSKYADYESLIKKLKNLEVENLDLKKVIDDHKESESNSLNKIAELEKNINSWEIKSLKQQIAIKNGLPFELANRLQGDNEESLEEDAIRLASLVSIKQYTQPLADTEPPIDKGIDSAWRDVVRNLK